MQSTEHTAHSNLLRCQRLIWLMLQVFARWLSIVFMAAVHLGLPRSTGQAAEQEPSNSSGWAWAGEQCVQVV